MVKAATTDTDVADSALDAVASFALKHLPKGSKAWVERGVSGSPHVLFLQPAGLNDNEFKPLKARGRTLSCPFYDRLTPVRWQMAVVEEAQIALRRSALEAKGAGKDELQAQYKELSGSAGKLMSERHRLEAKGDKLLRTKG
jgi:hypothetical protein